MKTLHFITGLPRSGSTMIANILKQNPTVHGEAVSSLSGLFGTMHNNWLNFTENLEYPNLDIKKNVLHSLLEGYYKHIDKSIIFDRSLQWVSFIPLLETVLERKVKLLVTVRNPAEILASFEKLRRSNPLFTTKVDMTLGKSSSIESRSIYYSGPDGELGLSHRLLKNAISMNYLDRMLFVDYGRFCNTPKAQTKRIYEFFEMPEFEHNFNSIEQTEVYNDYVAGLPNLHKIKPSLQKTTINCIEFLGIDLYDQYNREVFWNALV